MKRALIIAMMMLAPAAANAITLVWPLDCTLDKTCFIQNYVDHDTTAAARDYTCAPHSYDGHDGTDIRLTSLAAMRTGVTVKAVADGVVLGTRSNIPDNGLGDDRKARILGKECGNGVNIQHADGYRTQYCHMMQHSIRVRTGQQVKAGDALGQIGLSGQTEFPHLHLGVWKNDVPIDPFTGSAVTTACNASLAISASGLWTPPITYQPSALLNDGFADDAPDKDRMRDTPLSPTTLPANSPALLYWVDVINLRAGDVLAISITAPDGSSFAQKSIPIGKPMAAYFGFIGKKNTGGKLTVGNYKARVTLTRNQAVIISQNRLIDVR
jgi:hypothetical protein